MIKKPLLTIDGIPTRYKSIEIFAHHEMMDEMHGAMTATSCSYGAKITNTSGDIIELPNADVAFVGNARRSGRALIELAAVL